MAEPTPPPTRESVLTVNELAAALKTSRRKKKDAETVTPPPRPKRRLLMTKAEWQKIADSNARSEREPDPAQFILPEIAR